MSTAPASFFFRPVQVPLDYGPGAPAKTIAILETGAIVDLPPCPHLP